MQNIIMTELGGLYGNEVIKEMNEIIKLYDIYEGPGQDWIVDEKDYTPTKKKTNYIKKLIKEEARFLFGKTPIFTVQVEDDKHQEQVEEIKDMLVKYNGKGFADYENILVQCKLLEKEVRKSQYSIQKAMITDKKIYFYNNDDLISEYSYE